MKRFFALLFYVLLCSSTLLADVVLRSGQDLTIAIRDDGGKPMLRTAEEIFSHDYQAVFGGSVVNATDATIQIGTVGKSDDLARQVDAVKLAELRTYKEGFLLQVKGNRIYIIGADERGTAYGILELSRLIGVSPWEWWADAGIARKKSQRLKDGYLTMQHPSVAQRGIFLNDEDWGLTPWSYLTHEPNERKGTIGPKTHARIFELLLRLRANTFWPAMHECSVAFYLTPQNKEMAEKYGIYIGTSHCEPMLRNTNAEWKLAGKGSYDYVNNRQQVLDFWRERVTELAEVDNIYTLGIRGVHDSKMLGANTLEEQKEALTNVLRDQRNMLAELVNPQVDRVPQVFIPYKEVLDVYQMGLDVPDDVTLLWCDDNYGYIRHFPTAKERARKGGNGIYYHISYWGRPHDYLWLATNHPAQVYTQMKLAYQKGAQRMWILNVGDIKPAEYLTELFLDMAWDIDGIADDVAGLDKHLQNWLIREFGSRLAPDLLTVMNEYYRLAYIRKPEFMGNTRTEEKDPVFKEVKDLPWSEEEIRQRLSSYEALARKVGALSSKIPAAKKDAWFQLIEYPVVCAAEMNRKHLYAQLARHGKAGWEKSDDAFAHIDVLTKQYNNLGGGKWKFIMNEKPRELAVFQPVSRVQASGTMPITPKTVFSCNGVDYLRFTGNAPVGHGLGYERGAVSIDQGSSLTYDVGLGQADSVQVRISLAPNHPVAGNTLRCQVFLDGGSAVELAFQTEGRSEEWKENVLTNQSIRTIKFAVHGKTRGRLTVKALDEGVILDQIKVQALQERLANKE